MELSNYNVIKKTKKGSIIYNSFSGGLIELDKQNTQLLLNKQFADIDIAYITDLEKNGIVVSSQEDELLLFERLKKQHINNSALLKVTILPTTNCNLDCDYCFERKRKMIMSKTLVGQMREFLRSYITDMGHYKVVSLNWFGGEPLLNIELLEFVYNSMISLIAELRLEVINTVITNGTLLDKNRINLLKKMNNLQFVQVTIDGVKEMHDKRRVLIGGSSFDLIINNIKQAINSLPIVIRINIDKRNLDEIEQLILELSEIPGLKENVFIDFAKVIGDKSSCYRNDEFSLKFKYFENLLKKYQFRHTLMNMYPQSTLVQCDSITNHNLVIDANGDIYRCIEVLGDKTYCIGNIMEKRELKDNKIKENEYAECKKCNIYPICHGGCPLNIDKERKYNCLYNSNLLLEHMEWMVENGK